MKQKDFQIMKCSVELPIEYLSLSSEFDFDFVIASTCLEHPEYLQYFCDRGDNPRFTILDNGAFETGNALKDEQYIAIARQIKPDVLVIPDVFRDFDASVERFVRFMRLWEKTPKVEKGHTQLMGVLQVAGNIKSVEILSSLFNIYNINWVGIPYAAGLDRFQLIQDHGENWLNVHILGLPHLSEALALRELPQVKSIDSSLAVKVTADGKRLLDTMGSDSYKFARDKGLDPELLRENLQTFTKLCNFGGTIECK